MSDMRRREFITLLGGAAAWPFAAHAQQPEKVRWIGALINRPPDDRKVTLASRRRGNIDRSDGGATGSDVGPLADDDAPDRRRLRSVREGPPGRQAATGTVR
jgi:hypothetical protein